MPKKPKKRSYYINKLDKLCREICLDAADNKCELCGKSDGVLHWHHYRGRRPHLLRWNFDNCIICCYQCHCGGFHSDDAEKQREYRKKFIALRGEAIIENLAVIKNQYTGKSYSISDLKELIEVFKKLKKTT